MSNVKRIQENQGGQPGHKKHERSLLPVEEIDHLISCNPNEKCLCGGTILKDNAPKRRHQQYELPVIKPTATEYQIYSGACVDCDKKHTGKLPSGVTWSMLGARAAAMTAHLSGTYRMSKRNIVGIYQDFFGFQLSSGMVCKAEKTVSKSLKLPVDQAKHFIRSARDFAVNADETGFKEKGKAMWAWIAISQKVVAFVIRKSRGKNVAQELLGASFKGILCSDRYSAYQWVPENQRQICWAHLDRDFRKISERSGTSEKIGIDLLKQTDDLFHHWHQFKEKKLIEKF